MFGLPIVFAYPLVLAGLLLLPAIWWLLRLTPPRPKVQDFPATRLLAEIAKKEDTPDKSPWWLTLIRLVMAAAAIIALSGPAWQPQEETASKDGPLILIVDNGWTTAKDWNRRAETATGILEEAARNDRTVALVMTTDAVNADVRFDDAATALERFTAQEPQPYREDRAAASKRISTANLDKAANIIWLASPLAGTDDADFADTLSEFNSVAVRFAPGDHTAISGFTNGANTMDVELKRLTESNQTLTLRALDKDGLSIADVPLNFEAGSLGANTPVELPIELRNQITQLTLIDENSERLRSAGATYLVDDRSRRRTVGLLSGVSADLAQPLLSPLYYINRALEPFAELREAQTPNLAEAIPNLLQAGVSMLVMADVGTIPTDETENLRKFMSNGGTVVRFAGPRLAASEDTLTPVNLRAGERSLGGSLTWEQPQKLARFSNNGPFAAMDLPGDIEIKRQVLAEPDFDLLQKTWAELEDGTPLVTAEQVGQGWLVLFHVTADATWSNLPISGAFVEMLTKLVAFSSVPAGTATDETANDLQILSPFQTLDAFGRLGPAQDTAEALNIESILKEPSRTTPPGYYGKPTSLIAYNLMQRETSLEPLDPSILLPEATVSSFGEAGTTDLRPGFFSAMIILLLVDSLIVAMMAGLFSKLPTLRKGAAGIIAISMIAISVQSVDAQNSNLPYEATLTTRLAYVVTGDSAVDEISQAGLQGLTDFLFQRTALEPGEPVGVDISTDELAFYPLLYWPVNENSAVPDAATMARVDAFMKQGGTVLFDTKDQLDAGFGSTSPANLRLREIVSSLDIPPLEPVPANHVLTRAFYLLQDFPGRWTGSPLWVEANEGNENVREESRSQADGVSSILITANDFAGAWATDETGHPLLPTVPSDPTQRVYSFRTGVNIVMYTLTGNYKADQVHIPALLERLGQ